MLLPADLNKIQIIHSRTCYEGSLFSLSISISISQIYVCQPKLQQIQIPTAVNKALEKLIEVNPFHAKLKVDESWKKVNKECNFELWNLLTNSKAESLGKKSDSDKDINMQVQIF